MIRVLAMLAAALLLALPAHAGPEAPPAALAAHIRDGVPDADDIGWMRGAFPGASEAEKADWLAIQDWVSRCFATRTAEIRAALIAKGFTPPESGETFAPPLCAAVASLTPMPGTAGDWDAFVADNRAAASVFATLRYGARLGADSAGTRAAGTSEDATTLTRATFDEQLYRNAMSWSVNGGPVLAAGVQAVLMRRITMMIVVEDGRNTAKLKAMVAANGWPSIERVGAPASQAAWLIVQHADMDPLFQLDALRLMEPLVASGGVTKQNYAYLYDRVMLKVRGTQRYGTQVTCANGKRAPQPLEPGIDVDALRASIGLEPIAAYIALIDSRFPACPVA